MSDENKTAVLSPQAQVESVLFVADGPVSVRRLARTVDITDAEMRQLLRDLEWTYADRGLRLQWIEDKVQLTTAPEAAATVERFLGLEVPVSRLSQAAVEVLSIVAYLQPVTRPQVDEIRGVNSDGSLRTLLSKGLLEEVGRMDAPGRPILYGTTPEFLQHFGLGSLAELPPLPDVQVAEEEIAAEMEG